MSSSTKHDSGMDPRTADDPSDADRDPERQSGGLADWMSALRDVTPYLALGWRLAGSAAGPPLLGHLVDWLWGTTPWGLLGGAIVGFATVVVQLRRLQEDFER